MTTFVEDAREQESRISNGVAAHKTTTNKAVDLFFNIGASRGKDIIPAFTAAYAENKDLALRIALWARDARGGAGERKLFRDILVHLETVDTDAAKALINKTILVGRWDDLLVFKTPELQQVAFTKIKNTLVAGIQAKSLLDRFDAMTEEETLKQKLQSQIFEAKLVAKWMPRENSAKRKIAQKLIKFFGWSPKYYRKTLVSLTSVVENKMCANDWDNINFSHVPSLASSRYKKAFNRHTPKFAEYVQSLINGEPTVKVNAGAVYPYDIIKGIGIYGYDKTENAHIVAQWDSLPNYVGDANILPLVDVSGSMQCRAGGNKSNSDVTCMDVAVSLGLYIANKNSGKFKDTFITFSETPELRTLRGNIVEKATQMIASNWGMGTNLHAAFDLILDVATKFDVPQSEMPEMLLILTDMQFNCCTHYDDSAIKMIERKYTAAGYNTPLVVFWNINSSDNVPVKADKSGAALVSGFSSAIVKSLLAADMGNFTPEGICLNTVMIDRYTI